MQEKSTYNLTTFINEEIVKIIITGEVTKDNVKELANEVYAIVKLTNAKKLLCDIREIKGRLGYTDIYFFATDVPSFFYNINTVFVDLPKNAKLQSFRQYVTRLNGIPAKWCTDTDDAISWLQSTSERVVN